MIKTIAVIGGGASGIAAAITAAEGGQHVLLLEAAPRIGKKILSTGNGRCNLGNRDIRPIFYHSSQPARLQDFLAQMPGEMTEAFFHTLGLRLWEEDGRLYPYARQASMVLDVLLLALSQRNVDIRANCPVIAIRKRNGRFLLQTAAGEEIVANSVILASGGRAGGQKTGASTGYELAKSLGHSCTALYPSLVPLTCRDMPGGLKGQRVIAKAALRRSRQKKPGKDEILWSETGEIQFTDFGLSGIPVLQISGFLQGHPEEYTVSLDLYPGDNNILAELRGLQKHRLTQTLETAFLGGVPKRVLYAVEKAANLGALSRRADSLTEGELASLAETLCRWDFPLRGTLSWEKAQTTGGGIPLGEEEETFASRCCPGLFITGELLDATGFCGGYNLHWAWCSGILAGRAAGRL